MKWLTRCVLVVYSGTVSVFQPLSSCVWQEGLRFEPKRNLFSPSQHRRILLPSAASPSPKRLSGREAVRHVTKPQRHRTSPLNAAVRWSYFTAIFGSFLVETRWVAVLMGGLGQTLVTWRSDIDIFTEQIHNVHVPELICIHALNFVLLKLLRLLLISCRTPLKRFIFKGSFGSV